MCVYVSLRPVVVPLLCDTHTHTLTANPIRLGCVFYCDYDRDAGWRQSCMDLSCVLLKANELYWPALGAGRGEGRKARQDGEKREERERRGEGK